MLQPRMPWSKRVLTRLEGGEGEEAFGKEGGYLEPVTRRRERTHQDREPGAYLGGIAQPVGAQEHPAGPL